MTSPDGCWSSTRSRSGGGVGGSTAATRFVAVGLLGMASRGDFIPPGASGLRALPIDLTGDLGVRLDTSVGIFTLSVANALSRVSF